MSNFKRYSKIMFYGLLVMLFTATQSIAAPAGGPSTAVSKSAVKDAGSKKKATSSTMRMKKESMLADLPSISITRFKKAVPGGTMMSTMNMSGTSSSSSPPPSIELGEEIELYWSITYKNVRTPRVTIDGQVVTGTAQTASDGTRWMAGRKTFRPASTKTYNLVVTAAPEGGGRGLRKQQSLRVTVKKPVLTVLEPEVDQDNLTIKFFAKNTGNADFRPTPINVNYEIDGGRLATGSFTTPRIEIAKNQRVELGRITLPDRARAFQNNSIRIRINIGAYYVQPLREARGDFTHEWTARTTQINDAMLNLLGMATTCEIVIDNWDETSGTARWIQNPYQENACLVDFNVAGSGTPFRFTLPYFDDERTEGPLAIVYRTFLRNIRASHRGDSDLFSVSDGKMQITLEFDGRDSREIKIGRVGQTGSREGKWKDDAVPDVNLSAFTVIVKVTPALSGGQLTYSDVDVSISGLSADFPGGWSWLNAGFRNYATRTVRNTLDSALTGVLSSGSIKNAIIDGINSGISATGTDITRILSVRGSGNTITVEYL